MEMLHRRLQFVIIEWLHLGRGEEQYSENINRSDAIMTKSTAMTARRTSQHPPKHECPGLFLTTINGPVVVSSVEITGTAP